jgi:hypothetical protein
MIQSGTSTPPTATAIATRPIFRKAATAPSLTSAGTAPAAPTRPINSGSRPTATTGVTASPLAALVEPIDVLKAAFAGEPGIQAGLERLKDSKALEDLDASGKSLLTHLVELIDLKTSVVVGMPSGKDLVRLLVTDLADPSQIYQGTGTTTCTVASMQSILASAQPAEYARLAGELARTGKADMIGGGRLEILPADFTAKEGRNPLADAFQESLFRLGSALGGTASSGVAQFGAVALKAARKVFAGEIPGGLTIEQYSRLHEMLTGYKRVLVEPDASVWNQLIMNRVDDKGREKTMNATAFLAPEPGGTIGHAVVIERLSQMPDGSLMAHVRDPMSPGVKQIPLADLQARVQLLEMDAPTVSSSKTYLDQVARRQV